MRRKERRERERERERELRTNRIKVVTVDAVPVLEIVSEVVL
jgi:hypothetical protein